MISQPFSDDFLIRFMVFHLNRLSFCQDMAACHPPCGQRPWLWSLRTSALLNPILCHAHHLVKRHKCHAWVTISTSTRLSALFCVFVFLWIFLFGISWFSVPFHSCLGSCLFGRFNTLDESVIDLEFDSPSREGELKKRWKIYLGRFNMWMGQATKDNRCIFRDCGYVKGLEEVENIKQMVDIYICSNQGPRGTPLNLGFFDFSLKMMIDWQVMSASDQLRQRMAWALAQILVVGTGGFDHGNQNELWLNFYDILVRKAGGEGCTFSDCLESVMQCAKG